ncbi:MAG: TcfC E-set like domain-containing protein, partial [Candidatus Lariskella arthropodorum]
MNFYLKTTICLMYTSWFLVSPYNAFGSMSKDAINQSIPAEFMDLMRVKGVDVALIYQDRSVAETKVYLLPEGYQASISQELQNMGIKSQYVKYLSAAFAKGIPSLTYTIRCSEELQKQLGCFENEVILNSTLDLDNLTLTLEFSKSSYQSVTSTNNTAVKLSSVSALSSSFNYNINVSQGFGELATDAYALSLANVSSFKNTHLSSAWYLGNSDGKSKFDIDNIQLIHDLERSSVALSYGGGLLGAGSLSQMNYAYPGDVITASWYSNSSINDEENYVSLRPIDIFVGRASTAQVYKDGRLIGIQMLNPGVQKLDTASFPSGIYQIRIDVYEGSELVKQYYELIEKPFSISGIDNRLGFAFALWSGLAAKIDQSENFDQIYIGGSIAKALNKYWLSKVSFYQAGNLSVLEIDNEFLLPYDIALIANAGIDDTLGYGLSLSVSKSFNNMISMSLSYSQNNGERENSPFSTKNQLLGINTSLNLLDWGSLYLGISYDLDNNSSYYSSYNHTLYDRYGLTLDFTAGLYCSGS